MKILNDYEFDIENRVWVSKAFTSKWAYNDGDDIENYIFDVIKNSHDRSVFSDELKNAIKDWPTLYHLGSQRANILRPCNGELQGPILEIGAGCGAITRYLGELGVDVIALEGGLRRATIIAERCKELSNVRVVVDSFEEFSITNQFQTIVMVGVLEYARVFWKESSGEEPVELMLRKIRQLLAPGGRLILAIENKLGLKYFAGFPEDHLGKIMYGIEGRYGKNEPVTFGRVELDDLLSKAGFQYKRWTFPFPDYKLATTIIEKDALDNKPISQIASIVSSTVSADHQQPSQTFFDLRRTWKGVIENGLGAELANSFVVIAASTSIETNKTLVHHYGGVRKSRYAKYMSIEKEGDVLSVKRKRLVDGDEKNIHLPFYIELKDEKYYDGVIWSDELTDMISRGEWSFDCLMRWTKTWLDALWYEIAKVPDMPFPLNPEIVLSEHLLDAIPKNMVLDSQNQAHFIDLEWYQAGGVRLGQLIFRGLLDALRAIDSVPQASWNSPDIGMLIRDTFSYFGYALSELELYKFASIEEEFQRQVLGTKFDGVIQNQLNVGIKRKISSSEILSNMSSVSVLKQTIAEMAKAQSTNMEQLDELQNIIEAEKLKSAEKEKKIAEAQSYILEQKKVIEQIFMSNSWRITAPIRFIMGKLKNKPKIST